MVWFDFIPTYLDTFLGKEYTNRSPQFGRGPQTRLKLNNILKNLMCKYMKPKMFVFCQQRYVMLLT